MNTAFSNLTLQADAAATGSKSTWLSRTSTAIWRALEDSGRANARRKLLEFASRFDAQQPDLAKELRSAANHWPQA